MKKIEILVDTLTTKVLIDGKEVENLMGFEIRGGVGEVTELNLKQWAIDNIGKQRK